MIRRRSSRGAGFRLLIVGGGVAAAEAALAVRDIGDGRFDVALIASSRDFVYRPVAVLEAFSGRPPRTLSLDELATAAGARFVHDAITGVDVAARLVRTASNDEVPYDALAIAVGATPRECLIGARTIDVRRVGDSIRGLLAEIDSGIVSQIAFVIPAVPTWPLPAYELALLTAAYARNAGKDHEISLVTVEDGPLAVFGSIVSEGVAGLLSNAGVALVAGAATVELAAPGDLVIGPGERRLRAERVIAMPELVGPFMEGLPHDTSGFIPVLPDGNVRGVERVFAAGDATDFPIKHGGVAGKQADLMAASIAALAGCKAEPLDASLSLTGVLLTGAEPYYLSARITEDGVRDSSIGTTPTWSPVAKIGAPKLADFLDNRWALLDKVLVNAMRDPITYIRGA